MNNESRERPRLLIADGNPAMAFAISRSTSQEFEVVGIVREGEGLMKEPNGFSLPSSDRSILARSHRGTRRIAKGKPVSIQILPHLSLREAGAVGNGQGFTILIVEDQALIALEIEDAARRNGAAVVGSAARLSEALTLIETASWDAALLDMKLANGEAVYPVAERLQAKGVPFAFLTAWDGDVDARYCDVPMLSKPFSLAELESCLQTVIGGRLKPVDREVA